MTTIAKAGNSGPRVRSDCFVQVELSENGGILFELKSRVASLYKKSITDLVHEVLNYFDIEHAKIEMVDRGALPWVISARLEAAIKQLKNSTKEYLPEFNKKNEYDSEKEHNRFTRLYLPGNTPSLFINAGLHKPDAIILDLEDSVAPEKKDEARILVRNALRACDFYGAERMVRINQGKRGIEDLKYVIPHNAHLILIPKTERISMVQKVESEIINLCRSNRIFKTTFLMPIIESALGVENAFEIAKASQDIVALAIGLEDYTADIGARRTNEGSESFYARSRIVNAAHAVGVQPIDSVFSDIDNMDALLSNAKQSKGLGFMGMGCIHPRQIAVIKEGFAPLINDIEKAKQIVFAAKKAKKLGLGVVAFGSKMIDAPVVKRHMKEIDLAINMGLLKPDWEGGMVE